MSKTDLVCSIGVLAAAAMLFAGCQTSETKCCLSACADKAKGDAPSLAAKIAESCKVTGTDVWYGGRRTIFDFMGYEAWVVEPPADVKVAEGRPWTWTMQWKTAFVPRTGVPRLLKMGYHHVTIDTFQNRMDAKGLEVSAAFQRFLVEKLGLAPKARLIGMSWGGFFSIRYAATYPQNVAKIYLDAPLLTFTGFGKPTEDLIGPWSKSVPKSWDDDPRMPVNMCPAVAKAGIPILLLYGGADPVVPPKYNAEVLAKRVKEAGGDIKVTNRSFYAHHPHGVDLDNPTIVDFFTK